MSETTLPSQVSLEIATVLDDNLEVSIAKVVEFETALFDNPADLDLRRVYRDWLLENDCTKRVAQLDADLAGKMPVEYTGPVKPQQDYRWSRL